MLNEASAFCNPNRNGHVPRPPRPQALSVRLHNIPAVLSERPQWVAWRLAWRQSTKGLEHWTKEPLNARTGRLALANTPSTWSDFKTALAYHRAHPLSTDGIGYVFSADDPYTGIDLDKCRDPDTAYITAWAADIVETVRSYTEASPSGTGLKIWLAGRIPAWALGTATTGRKVPYHTGTVEFYHSVKYFTVTGHLFDLDDHITIESRQEELEQVLRWVLTDREVSP
jgi:putative DNA primase/helicase